MALLLPAMPGSGKSTLTAALSQSGWRLLSDEFGAFDPAVRLSRRAQADRVEESVDRCRSPIRAECNIRPRISEDSQGDGSAPGAAADAVTRRHESARPGAVILPKWEAGSPTRFESLPENVAFSSLAFNAFNYSLLGAVGFQSVVQLVRQCPAWQLVYSDLDDALATIDGLAASRAAMTDWPRGERDCTASDRGSRGCRHCGSLTLRSLAAVRVGACRTAGAAPTALGAPGRGLEGAGLIDRVPAQPRRHLLAERRVSHWRTSAMTWALERISTALGRLIPACDC